MATALIIDDAPTVRAILARMISAAGVDTLEAGDDVAAIRACRDSAPDVIFLDLNLGSVKGLDILRAIRDFGFTMPVIVVSGQRDPHVVVEVLSAGVVDFVAKPFQRERVLRALGKALPEVALTTT